MRKWETKKSIAHNLGNIGLIHDDMGRYPEALGYEFKALAINEELGNNKSIVNNCRNIGTVYYHIAGDTTGAVKSEAKRMAISNAIKYLDKGLVISQKIGDLDKSQEIYDLSAKVYVLSGNYKKAFESYKQFILIRDSIFSEQNAEKITGLITNRSPHRQKEIQDALRELIDK